MFEINRFNRSFEMCKLVKETPRGLSLSNPSRGALRSTARTETAVIGYSSLWRIPVAAIEHSRTARLMSCPMRRIDIVEMWVIASNYFYTANSLFSFFFFLFSHLKIFCIIHFFNADFSNCCRKLTTVHHTCRSKNHHHRNDSRTDWRLFASNNTTKTFIQLTLVSVSVEIRRASVLFISFAPTTKMGKKSKK